MGTLVTLAQALGVAYASGINLYATVMLLGLGDRYGLIGPLPGSLAVVGSLPVIILAGVLFLFEFAATLEMDPGPAAFTAKENINFTIAVGIDGTDITTATTIFF